MSFGKWSLQMACMAFALIPVDHMASAQESRPSAAQAQQDRLQRILSIRRDCSHASYADEPSIADILAKSDLVIVGTGGLRMYLKESPLATGTDWDKGKRVVEIRVEHVIKGEQPGRSIPVVFIETPDFPLNYHAGRLASTGDHVPETSRS